MNIEKLLCGVDCSCGKHHGCDIKHVIVKEGAIEELGALLGGYKNVLLVADENTFSAAGERTEAALGGKELSKCIFSGEQILIPDERAVEAVKSRLGRAEIIVGIGSGVIQDICKYVSHEQKIPYYIVATAPSMDGYASTGAAMITAGMKVTYSAGLPEGIIADVDVLKNAPIEMIKAGYGDIIGKYSALSDWRLAKEALGEYFCEYVWELTMSMLKQTLPLAKKLLNRDADSVKTLTEALIGVGIAMSFVGNSRPASGSEHHLSHFFEITGIVHKAPYLPHGIDVLYSTVVTAALREELLRLNSFARVNPEQDEGERKKELERVYLDVSHGCTELQERIGTYKADRIPSYEKNREKIRAALAECPRASEIEALVREIGLDMKDFYDVYGKEKIMDAVRYAKDLKDRYTVLWMYYDIFGTEVTLNDGN